MSYKGMSGGLFDGKPLEPTRDPSRDIRIAQIVESLKTLHRDPPLKEEIMLGIWRKCGKEGTPDQAWKDHLLDGIKQEAAMVPDPTRNKDVTPKMAGDLFHSGPRRLAVRLVDGESK